MNLSFSKQINEGDTIVVSLCSYYMEIASLIGTNHYFELINIDIVRENGQSAVPMNALSDICKTLVKVIIENMGTGDLYAHLIYRNRHKDVIAALVDEILEYSDAILSQK